MKFMEPIFERAGYRDARSVDAPQTILIIHDGAAGDFVSMSAAIRELRRFYPDAHIILMATHLAMNLAELCPYVDEVYPNTMPWGELPLAYQRNFSHCKFLLRRRIDVCYAFTHFPSTNILAYMSGARERISFEFGVDDSIKIETGLVYATMPLLTVRVPLRLHGTHNIDKNLGLLDYTLHIPIKNREPEVWFSPMELAIVQKSFCKYLDDGDKMYALCMGGTRPSKKWSAENYAGLIKMILEHDPKTKISIIGGGKADAAYAEVFQRTLGEKLSTAHIFDFTNNTSYRQSAAILSCCDMYIGNDTGTMHMAAAVKIPVLMPHYYAKDLPGDVHTALKIDYPYHVPSVVIQPEHALDDCKGSTTHYGCNVLDRPHCIRQIKIETVFRAYQSLKKRIAENICEPLFVS